MMKAPKLSDLHAAISDLHDSIPAKYHRLYDILALLTEAYSYIEAVQADLDELETAFTEQNSYGPESLDQAIKALLEHRNKDATL